MTEYGIELSVKDKNNNIYPKYFGYDDLETTMNALIHFYKLKETKEYMHVAGLGNFWVEGDISLIIR